MSELTYGLVLSGGGIRGLAHVGVIKALEEEGISPTYIAGASAGAIVGAFYAAGYSAEDILAFFHKTTILSINRYAYRKPGLIDTNKFYDSFREYFPEDSFEALEKNLYISATDILAGKSKFFHKGPLINAVLASAAFPVVLSPVAIDEVLYADGGITNNFPVEPLLALCDKIIGVYVNPLRKVEAKDLSSSWDVMDRVFKIGMSNMSVQKFGQCDLIIAPDQLSEFGTFSMSHLDDSLRIGYEAAQSRLADIRKLKEQ